MSSIFPQVYPNEIRGSNGAIYGYENQDRFEMNRRNGIGNPTQIVYDRQEYRCVNRNRGSRGRTYDDFRCSYRECSISLRVYHFGNERICYVRRGIHQHNGIIRRRTIRNEQAPPLAVDPQPPQPSYVIYHFPPTMTFHSLTIRPDVETVSLISRIEIEGINGDINLTPQYGILQFRNRTVVGLCFSVQKIIEPGNFYNVGFRFFNSSLFGMSNPRLHLGSVVSGNGRTKLVQVTCSELLNIEFKRAQDDETTSSGGGAQQEDKMDMPEIGEGDESSDEEDEDFVDDLELEDFHEDGPFGEDYLFF